MGRIPRQACPQRGCAAARVRRNLGVHLRQEENVPRAKSPPESAGDAWTWVALNPETKMVVNYLTGQRDTRCALEFMADVRQRLVEGKRIQLTTDGIKAYLDAVEQAFAGNVDYA